MKKHYDKSSGSGKIEDHPSIWIGIDEEDFPEIGYLQLPEKDDLTEEVPTSEPK